MTSEQSEIQNRGRRGSKALSICLLVLFCFHAMSCLRMVGGRAQLLNSDPILVDDHSFNYYYCQATKQFLRQSGTTAGYDPFFMAGYAKSIVFPSSATLPETLTYLFPKLDPAQVFKLYVIGSAALLPVLIWMAALLLTPSQRVQFLAVVFYLLLFWTHHIISYLRNGMVSYLIACPLSLLATACFDRFLCLIARRKITAASSGDGRPSFIQCTVFWLLATLLGSTTCLTHVTAPLVLLPAWLLLFVLRWRSISWSCAVMAMLIAPIVVAANLFWLWPGITLWQTKGATEIGFVNPNVMERMGEILRLDTPIELALILSAFAVLFPRKFAAPTPDAEAKSSCGAVNILPYAVTLGLTFFLGYFAGWFRALDPIQPGRYTVYFYAWASIIGALGIGRLQQFMQKRFSARLSHGTLIVIGVLVTAGVGKRLYENLSDLYFTEGVILPARIPQLAKSIINELTKEGRALPGERILFEEDNKGIALNGMTITSPLQDLRISPIIPLYSGLEVIGGPYLYTHNKTNFTQFGDGMLFGKRDWNELDFLRYMDWYDVTWVVFWSPNARAYFREHPDWITIVSAIRSNEQGGYLIARLKRQPAPAIVGSAIVRASWGKIEVAQALAKDGALVLRYHWTPRLKCNPPAKIESYPIGEDPVGLIKVIDPPKEFTITLEPW